MRRSRQILEEIRNLGRDSRAIHSEIRDLREEGAELRQQWLDEVRLNREVMRRNQVAFRDGCGLVSDGLEALREEVRDGSRTQIAILKELREESRAHTQAILSLIDRLEGGAAAT